MLVKGTTDNKLLLEPMSTHIYVTILVQLGHSELTTTITIVAMSWELSSILFHQPIVCSSLVVYVHNKKIIKASYKYLHVRKFWIWT